MADRCPTCGEPVTVATGTEGTSHYESAARAEIARLRSEHETDASIANIRVDNLEAEIARLREIALGLLDEMAEGPYDASALEETRRSILDTQAREDG